MGANALVILRVGAKTSYGYLLLHSIPIIVSCAKFLGDDPSPFGSVGAWMAS